MRRFYIVYDSRAQAGMEAVEDRSAMLEAVGVRGGPPWHEVRRDWGNQGAVLVSYAHDNGGNLVDERVEGVIT